MLHGCSGSLLSHHTSNSVAGLRLFRLLLTGAQQRKALAHTNVLSIIKAAPRLSCFSNPAKPKQILEPKTQTQEVLVAQTQLDWLAI